MWQKSVSFHLTWNEAEELLTSGCSSCWKFIWVYRETGQVHEEIHAELLNASEAPLPLKVWDSGCWWSEECSWSIAMPCFLILPCISAVGHWWRQVTALPCTAFPSLEPVRELWGVLVKLGWVSCCVQPASTGHYARKYSKSCIAPSGDKFKFSLGSRQTWTDYLWASCKIQLAFLNWSIGCLRKIE